MNLKKIGKVFTSKFIGTGPSSYKKKKRIYRAAVSETLRNTAVRYSSPMSLTGVTLAWFYRPLLPLLLLFISSIHDIYKYVPETNHVSKISSVVAILWLQFTVHVILLSMLIFDTFTSVLPAVYL